MRDMPLNVTKEEAEKFGISRETRDLNDTYEMPMGKPGRPKQGSYVPGRYTKSVKPITQTETFKQMYVTHTKHPLTFREARFIDAYMAHGDRVKAVEDAGFAVKDKRGKARSLLAKDYIADEIAYRTEIYASDCIATRDEVMEFYTASMRGEVKDQFGLDPTLTDRLRAADSLKKILIDDVEKSKSVQAQQVVVNIDMSRSDDSESSEEPVIDIQQLSD